MIIKSKKLLNRKVVRMESHGSIKEIIIKEDLLNTDAMKINLYYRGDGNSGIIELTKKEIEMLYKEVAPKIDVVGRVVVRKFKK